MNNRRRYLSLFLACILLFGALVTVPSFAETDSTDVAVEIVAKNVYFGDAYYPMYAVDARNLAANHTVQVVLCDATGDTVYGFAKLCDEKATVNGKEYDAYRSEQGIPAQNLAVSFYAKAQVLNDKGAVIAESDVCEYSILEYIYQRQLSQAASETDIRLYRALKDYAVVAQTVLTPNSERKIESLAYVWVENGTLDGTRQSGLYSIDSETGELQNALQNLSTTLTVGGKTLAWTLTELGKDGTCSSKDLTDADAKKLALKEGTVIKLTAKLVDGAVATTKTFDVSSFFSKANSSYGSYETVDGWTLANAAANAFSLADGKIVPVLNGRVDSVGVLESAELSGGIQKLSFDCGLPNSDTNGVALQVEILTFDTDSNSWKTVLVETWDDSTVQKSGGSKGTFTWKLEQQIEGNFKIRITNASPSNSSSNKDRTAIWNLQWVSAT